VRRGDVLPLDEMTRRNLELVEPLRAAMPPHAGWRCSTARRRRWAPAAAALVARALIDPGAINARLDAVAVLAQDPRGRDRLREALDGVRDVERLAGRAALGRATPRELGALRDSILRLADVREAVDGLEARERASLLEEAAGSTCSPTWATSWRARWWSGRPLRRRTATRSGGLRQGARRAHRRARRRQGLYRGAAEPRARAHRITSLKVGYNRVFVTTSRSRTRTSTACRRTTNGGRPSRAPSATSRPS